MNFTDGAEVTVSGNKFYVNSQDSTWGPNAIQFYQNNTRDNDFTVTVDNNEFFVDGETSAVGVNVNGMNDPETYKVGAAVDVASSISQIRAGTYMNGPFAPFGDGACNSNNWNDAEPK